LEAHAILEHQKVIVQCDLCDFRTTDELSMESHLRDKHNLQPGMGAVAAATGKTIKTKVCFKIIIIKHLQSNQTQLAPLKPPDEAIIQ